MLFNKMKKRKAKEGRAHGTKAKRSQAKSSQKKESEKCHTVEKWKESRNCASKSDRILYFIS